MVMLQGLNTSYETFNATMNLGERYGKIVICSKDYSGFIVKGILMPMINEAFHALYIVVATKEDIDAKMKSGTDQSMGPLQLADFIGLDVCLSIVKVLQAGLGNIKYAPCPLLVHYVDAGRLGKDVTNFTFLVEKLFSRLGIHIYEDLLFSWNFKDVMACFSFHTFIFLDH